MTEETYKGDKLVFAKYWNSKGEELETEWYENGQKKSEETWKDGEPDDPSVMWHENGQKAVEGILKDDELVSGKYWNSKGEEVETREEAFK